MAQLVNKVGGMELKYCSLTSFPGLCHRPVFDCLQYAKMKREGRGNGEGRGNLDICARGLVL